MSVMNLEDWVDEQLRTNCSLQEVGGHAVQVVQIDRRTCTAETNEPTSACTKYLRKFLTSKLMQICIM